jgi:hypothetical protein
MRESWLRAWWSKWFVGLNSARVGQAHDDPVGVALGQLGLGPQATTTFGIFAGKQVASSGPGAHDFTGARDFKTFGYRFPSFGWTCSSHKIN